MDFSQMLMSGFDSNDPGRVVFTLRQIILDHQEPFMAIEKVKSSVEDIFAQKSKFTMVYVCIRHFII